MNITRRHFLAGSAAALALAGEARAGATRFRLLYSNDTTNIATCIGPYNRRGQAIRADMVRASIDEAAAADAQILQPGLGWVPLWRSRSYPIEDHLAWFESVSPGRTPNRFLRYMAAGGDILGDFVAHCRAIGRHPVASLRLNDIQVLRNVDDPAVRQDWVSRFYVDHPDYRLGAPLPGQQGLALNWAIPEVREAKLAFVEEMIDGYDIAAVELDFMRTDIFFRLRDTTRAQRRDVMAGFVSDVRRRLDEKAGARRLALCVRVPAIVDFHDAIGVDVAAFADAGVDVFTLSSSYYTAQRADIEAFRAAAPHAQHFLEMSYTSGRVLDPGAPEDMGLLRTSDLQYLATAREAVDRGGDGVALFNFAYFRAHPPEDSEPGMEPPFHLLPKLASPRAIGAGGRWWFVTQGWGKGPNTRLDWLPRWIKPKAPLDLDLYGERPGGAGVLRLRASEEIASLAVGARMNGHELVRTEPPSGVFDTPGLSGAGRPELFAYYACPADVMRSGVNRLRCDCATESRLVVSCDLVFPS